MIDNKTSTSKNSSIFSVFVISIFVLSLLFFVIAVSLESSHGKKTMQSQFSSLLEETKTCLSKHGINDSFVDAFSNEIHNYPNLAAIIITKDSVPFFAYPVSSTLFVINENSEPEMKCSSPSLKIFTSSI